MTGSGKSEKEYFDSLDSTLNYNQFSLSNSFSKSTQTCFNNINNECNVNSTENTEQNPQFNSLAFNNNNNTRSENTINDGGYSSVSEKANIISVDDILQLIITLAISQNNPNIETEKVDLSNTIKLTPQSDFKNTHTNFGSININNSTENAPLIDSNLETNNSTTMHNYTENLSLEQSFKSNLAKCIIHHKFNQVQTNALLDVLRTHPSLTFLPKTCRSLLKTPRNKVEVKELAPGEYLHIGLEEVLNSLLHRVSLQVIPSELLIDYSTDGVELNNETQMWPIQIRVVNLENSKPELVGIYKGPSKPNSFIDFFSYFVNEVNLVNNRGGIDYNNTKIPIKLRCFIADAPARAYVLNHYGNNSQYPCSKCYVEGTTHINTKRFPGINFKLRTNEEYRSLKDVDHNKGKSALHDLPVDLVQHVSFDYMHMVCLGVMKIIIESLVFGACLPKKLPVFKLKILNNRFTTLQLHCPREFARNPRELDKLSNFKATEFRQILLYTFIVVFRGIITEAQYNHFLLLHSSMRMLLKNSSPEEVDFAENSLKKFVLQAEDIHGLHFLTYNTHGVLHLASDYKLFGPLDKVSAFQYENSMPKYRDSVRKYDKPLQQLHNGIHEESQFPGTTDDNIKNFKGFNVHKCGPIPDIFDSSAIQYESLQTPSFFFSIQNTDNTIMIRDGQIGIIKNIITCDKEYFFVAYFFKDVQSFYFVSTQPSTNFGVFVCTSLRDSAVIISYDDIQSKCYRMPLWVNKPFPDKNANDELLNNTYVAVVL